MQKITGTVTYSVYCERFRLLMKIMQS